MQQNFFVLLEQTSLIMTNESGYLLNSLSGHTVLGVEVFGHPDVLLARVMFTEAAGATDAYSGMGWAAANRVNRYAGQSGAALRKIPLSGRRERALQGLPDPGSEDPICPWLS